jgi:hypothetical protein
MGRGRPPPPPPDPGQVPPPLSYEQTHVQSLLEENAQLRELVVQLSKLVIKNIVDHK